MRREHRQLAHFGAPVLFLLGLTIVVLIVRGGFGAGTSTRPASTGTRSTSVSTSTSTTTTAKTVTTRTYTIRSGDTLGAIAVHFGVSVSDLMTLNKGIDPTGLRVGQKITVGKAPASQ